MSLENIKIQTTVPQEWADQLCELSLETGRTVEELVQEALGQYLERIKTAFVPASIDLEASNIEVQKELSILKQKVQSLEQLLNQVAKLEAKIFSLEKIVSPELSISPNSTFAQLLTNDEDYDEPDEIMTDFLPDSR
jgi:predicted DNA-binding protein